MSEVESVLVIAAHPDDEILGVGGTIRRHVLEGHKVHTLVMCKRDILNYDNKKYNHAEMGAKSATILGMSIEFLDYHDQRLDILPQVELITAIENCVRQHNPQIVYTHFGGDVNTDHKVLFNATLVAIRPMVESIRRVYAYDTTASTEWSHPQVFQPDTFIDISETLEAKLDAIRQYECELRDYPHPRSIEGIKARAAFYGSIACMEAAEPFITIRSYRKKGDHIW